MTRFLHFAMPSICPVCLRDDKTYPVRSLYLQIVARRQQQARITQDALMQVIMDLCPADRTQTECLDQLQEAFMPPSGVPQTTRRVHPDVIVVFFGLITLALTLQIALQPTASAGQPLAMLAALVMISLLTYGLARARMLARYRALLNQDLVEHRRVEGAITHWMSLFFCSRDQVVFSSDHPIAAPFQHTPVLCNEPDYL